MMFVVILAAFLPFAAALQPNVLTGELLNGAPCVPGSDEFVCKDGATCTDAPQLGDGSKTRCIVEGLECLKPTQKLCGDCCCSADTDCLCHDVATTEEPKANCRCSTKRLGEVCNPDAPNDECWNLPEGVFTTETRANCKTASDGKNRCLPVTLNCPPLFTRCAQHCCSAGQTCTCTELECECATAVQGEG